MPFTEPTAPFTEPTAPFTEPTTAPSSPPTYSPPSHSDLAAVATTVSVVGVLLALLLTWLLLRLRRASRSQSTQSVPISCRPASTASYVLRPSLAPSEAPSKFGFIRKSLHLSRKHEDASWDFADPDPFAPPNEKEYTLDTPEPALARGSSSKRRPTPLSLVPAITPRARRGSTFKVELSPHTPTTPGTPGSVVYLVEPPPPAYCPESAPWQAYQFKALSP